MIGKVSQGSGFAGCANYLLGKEKSELIGGNMLFTDPKDLAEEFSLIQRLNLKVERPVFHVSLNIAPHEHLSNDQWVQVAQKYMEGMEFLRNQFAVVRHGDRPHEHVHLLINLIDLTGQRADDSFCYPRTEVVLREIERDFGLDPVPCSWEVEKRSRLTPGQQGLERRTHQARELRSLIDRVIEHSTCLIDLENTLNAYGVQVMLRQGENGQDAGISYRYKHVSYGGSQLGAQYSFEGISERIEGSRLSLENLQLELIDLVVPVVSELESFLDVDELEL